MENLKFKSQKISYAFMGVSVLLFFLQTLFGLVAAAQFVWPNFTINWMPFNVSRGIHINLLLFWMLIGFMGASYFIILDEIEEELFSVKLAATQLILLVIAGVGAVISYFFQYYGNQGLEWVEAAPVFDWIIVVAALIWLFNLGFTIKNAKKSTPISSLYFIAAIGAVLMYLPGMPFFKDFVLQDYFRWWVIHYSVEATWEMFDTIIVGYLVIKLFHLQRNKIYRWLYIEVATILGSGILGMGHHYFWIGTPKYWLWVGSIFSALEVIPPIGMMIEGFLFARKSDVNVEDKATLYWLLVGTIGAFLGLGLLGGAITWYSVNFWEHGTQMTAAHGHMAFFGAFAAVELAFIYYALSRLNKDNYTAKILNSTRWEWGFWLMNIGMILMVSALVMAGAIQIYVSRVMGQGYVAGQQQMIPWYAARFATGIIFFVGVLAYAFDFIVGVRGNCKVE